jgi:exopolysaccharide biosynthesis polyprenyl glycosylphosphotransferase
MPILGLFAVQLVISVLWSVCAHKWYFAVFAPKRTAVIHDRGRDVGELIGTYGLSKKFEVCRTATLEECLEGNFAVLEGMQTVFLCGISSHDRNLILKQCVEKGITVYVLPKIGDIIMSGAKQMHLFHLPFLRVGRYDPAPEYLLMKRLFDILVSACALAVLSPLMLGVAIAIRRDGGPAFYRQKRLTRDGKVFEVLKFRSMRVDAEKDGVARLSTGDADPRITPIGHFIRKVRIDELPQLINILLGDMTIVGPRPERPEIAAQYEQELPEFRLRLQAKAGLTGYAQVYGKYNTTPYDKLQMDLMYIANPSFLEDLHIIFATIKILFLPESTEGVAEGQETAMK